MKNRTLVSRLAAHCSPHVITHSTNAHYVTSTGRLLGSALLSPTQRRVFDRRRVSIVAYRYELTALVR